VSPALPFSISKAKTLLLANGWNIVGGAMTCVKPGSLKGDCGPGVKVSDTLNFQLMYSNDSVPEQQVNQLFQSTCAAIGIKIVLKAASLDSVLGMISTAGTTTWDLADWGNGWIYTPRYYPSGETLFATGAVSNAGTYSNAAADKYISGTVFGGITLTQYNKYLALSDPVIYHPNAVTLLEVKSAVKGFSANPLGTMTPENWSE
jgi:peptide/nickel transport system substrate-binding protein